MITRTHLMGLLGMLGIVMLLYATTSAIDNAIGNVGHAYELKGDAP